MVSSQVHEEVECLHPKVSDGGICTDCSTDICSTESIAAFSDLSSEEKAGKLIHLFLLAKDTAEMYLTQREKSRDPEDPAKMKVMAVGGVIFRPPESILWAGILEPSYMIAQAIGYHGSISRWREVCNVYVDALEEDLRVSPQTP